MENKFYESLTELSCSDMYFLVREKYPDSKKLKAMFESKCNLE
tara:strand:- start:318 stop:446 length:129 start_codon:yes stop_codon:yes gene_type:complete